MDPNTIAIAVGYGRAKELGKAAEEVGKNVYQFSSSNGASRHYYAPDVTLEDADKIIVLHNHKFTIHTRTEVRW